MKIHMVEEEGCFGFDFIAESIADAALIARFAASATKEIRHLSAWPGKTDFTGYLVIGKKKNPDFRIRPR